METTKQPVTRLPVKLATRIGNARNVNKTEFYIRLFMVALFWNPKNQVRQGNYLLSGY